MSITEFLNWLLNSGGATIVASWVLERMPWFQKLDVEGKKWVFFGSSSGLSISAYLVLTKVSAETLALIAPYFAILFGTFTVVFLGQLFHKLDSFVSNK